jgi:hypothetical protein
MTHGGTMTKKDEATVVFTKDELRALLTALTRAMIRQPGADTESGGWTSEEIETLNHAIDKIGRALVQPRH